MNLNELKNMEKVLSGQFETAHEKRLWAYICSPLRAETHKERMTNMQNARMYMYYAHEKMDMVARAPHAYLPMLLYDKNPSERELALRFGLELVEMSDVLLVCGNRLSDGMKGEIFHALNCGIKVMVFSHPIFRQINSMARGEGLETSLLEYISGHRFMKGPKEDSDRTGRISQKKFEKIQKSADRLCLCCPDSDCRYCKVMSLLEKAEKRVETEEKSATEKEGEHSL